MKAYAKEYLVNQQTATAMARLRKSGGVKNCKHLVPTDSIASFVATDHTIARKSMFHHIFVFFLSLNSDYENSFSLGLDPIVRLEQPSF